MIRVRATQPGYDGKMVRRPGDEFEIDPKVVAFSKVWMERIGSEPSAELSPPNANGAAPSTPPSAVPIEALLAFYADVKDSLTADEKTPTGLPKKSVLQAKMGVEIDQGTFLSFLKAATEQNA